MMINWTKWADDIFEHTNEIARHYFSQSVDEVRIKPDGSPVTDADLEIEAYIAEAIGKLDGVGMIGEERNAQELRGGTVVTVDPIDGTANFVRGIPFFATLIGVVNDGIPIFGAVSEPMTNTIWHAELGQGCYKNKKRISSDRRCKLLSETLVLHGSLYGREAVRTPESIHQLLAKTPRQRNFGDYKNMMFMAEGVADIGLDFGLKIWDIVPLIPILQEAGCWVTDDLGGQDWSRGAVVVSCEAIHETVLSVLVE